MTLPRPRIYGLMYHDVVSPGALSGRHGKGPDRYKLRWADFLAHLAVMERVTTGSPLVLRGAPSRPEPGWALTFDDGGSSGLAVAQELARRQWRAYFFVTTGVIGRPGFLDRDAIREVDRMGHVIGSHSATHPSGMSALSHHELVREWTDSVAELVDILGKPVTTGSVPGGDYGSNVGRAAAQARVELLFTSEPVRRARFEHGCLILGRYSVRRHTSAHEAASAAAGETGPWIRQWTAWNTRKPAKILAGRRYDRIRSSVLRLRSGTSQPTDG
jgi:peptidoglycan/xylan/chitin deacetylase (PgdA/CDA1 family)